LVIISGYIFSTYLVSTVEEGGVPSNAGEESPSTLSPSDEEGADDADDGKVEPLADGDVLKELVKDSVIKVDWLALGVKGLDFDSIRVSKDGLAKGGMRLKERTSAIFGLDQSALEVTVDGELELGEVAIQRNRDDFNLSEDGSSVNLTLEEVHVLLDGRGGDEGCDREKDEGVEETHLDGVVVGKEGSG
jgi:hypothetical protein